VAFKKTDSSVNAVTITPHNTDTIDGVASFVLSVQYGWAILVSDGTSNWNIISELTSLANVPTLAGNNAFTGTNTFVTQSANDGSTKAATTAYADGVLQTYSGSASPLPGAIIQTGTCSISGGTGSISFPKPFNNACLFVGLTNTQSSPSNTFTASAYNYTTSGCSITNQGGVSIAYHYVAIGY
jgi:hypothetical protein